jgi:hypothetical protein
VSIMGQKRGRERVREAESDEHTCKNSQGRAITDRLVETTKNKHPQSYIAILYYTCTHKTGSMTCLEKSKARRMREGQAKVRAGRAESVDGESILLHGCAYWVMRGWM